VNKLSELCRQAPWHTPDGEITEGYLRDLYEKIRTGRPFFRGSEQANRALQLLRLAGLIEYTGKPQRWKLCE